MVLETPDNYIILDNGEKFKIIEQIEHNNYKYYLCQTNPGEFDIYKVIYNTLEEINDLDELKQVELLMEEKILD